MVNEGTVTYRISFVHSSAYKGSSSPGVCVRFQKWSKINRKWIEACMVFPNFRYWMTRQNKSRLKLTFVYTWILIPSSTTKCHLKIFLITWCCDLGDNRQCYAPVYNMQTHLVRNLSNLDSLCWMYTMIILQKNEAWHFMWIVKWNFKLYFLWKTFQNVCCSCNCCCLGYKIVRATLIIWVVSS